MCIANATVGALSKRYGTEYKYGPIHKVMYKATGSSIDYVYSKLKIEIPFVYELRPQSEVGNGFLLPANLIILTGLETLDSIITMLRVAKEIGYFTEKESSEGEESTR